MAGESIEINVGGGLMKIYQDLPQKNEYSSLGKIKKREKKKKKRKYTRKMLVEKFLRNIQERAASMKTAILPYGTKYYLDLGDAQIFVVEQPPQVRTITWSDYYKKPYSFNLALPFIVAIFVFQDEWLIGDLSPLIFYGNSPVKSLNSKLFHTNLPNISSQYHILCIGNTDIPSNGHNSVQAVNEVMNDLWSSEFNKEMRRYDDLKHFLNTHCSRFSFEEWAEKTKKDPKFILRVRWCPAGRLTDHLGKLIETLCECYECSIDAGYLKDGHRFFYDVDVTEEVVDAMYRCKDVDLTGKKESETKEEK